MYMTRKSVKYIMVLGAFCAAGAAAQTPLPQESTERTVSPYDRNPACRDRDVASTDPACIIQDGPAAVRQFGFDSTKPLPATPAQTPQGNVAPPASQGSAAPPVILVVPPQSGGGTAQPGTSIGR